MASDNSLLGLERRSLMKGLSAIGIAAAISDPAAATDSTEMPDSRGPLRNNRFIVEIDGIEASGFARVELPDATNTDVGYREGNDQQASKRKLKAGNEFDSLVLERGTKRDDMQLSDWYKLVKDGKVDDARSSIAVILLDEENDPAARWEFKKAWPARYDPPDLDATGSEVAMETIEILHEGMERVD